MEKRFDIAIAGGGLNGTTLALALAKNGFEVVLIDPVSAQVRGGAEFDGRGYALAVTSKSLLAALGVWKTIADHAEPILNIKVSDGRPGEGPSPLVLEFDHAEIEEGPMGFMIEDRYLRQALLSAVADCPTITQLNGPSVRGENAGEAGVRVKLSDGGEILAGLLVACDGRNSGIARRAGISRIEQDYGQTALVSAVAHERPHMGTAHQFFMPRGPLAILPLPGNCSSIVWAEATAEAQRISRLDDAKYLDELRPRFGDFLGAIDLAGSRFSYPLQLSFAERFVATRRVLVGDAAHAVHPIAGQGLNAGLKDVAALAEVLVGARRRGEDFGRTEVLERYQRWRRFDAASLALATDGFNRLFSNDNAVLRGLRDLGLGLVNAAPGLRRGLIREAAGLTGELPRLMQGRTL